MCVIDSNVRRGVTWKAQYKIHAKLFVTLCNQNQTITGNRSRKKRCLICGFTKHNANVDSHFKIYHQRSNWLTYKPEEEKNQKKWKKIGKSKAGARAQQKKPCKCQKCIECNLCCSFVLLPYLNLYFQQRIHGTVYQHTAVAIKIYFFMLYLNEIHIYFRLSTEFASTFNCILFILSRGGSHTLTSHTL